MKLRALEAVNTILFVFAVLGTNIVDLFNLEISQLGKVLVSIILIIIYVLIVWKKKYDKIHSFKEDSKAFSTFFTEWYSRPGKLAIFCADLDWLSKPKHAFVVDSLKRKGNNLGIYLRNEGKDTVAETLINSGARLFKIKESIKTDHRFSIRKDDGNQNIIIRNKDIKTDEIVFFETTDYKDPYLISMALDFLDHCYDN